MSVTWDAEIKFFEKFWNKKKNCWFKFKRQFNDYAFYPNFDIDQRNKITYSECID